MIRLANLTLVSLVFIALCNVQSCDIQQVNMDKVKIIKEYFNIKDYHYPWLLVGTCRFNIKDVEFKDEGNDDISNEWFNKIERCLNNK